MQWAGQECCSSEWEMEMAARVPGVGTVAKEILALPPLRQPNRVLELLFSNVEAADSEMLVALTCLRSLASCICLLKGASGTRKGWFGGAESSNLSKWYGEWLYAWCEPTCDSAHAPCGYCSVAVTRC